MAQEFPIGVDELRALPAIAVHLLHFLDSILIIVLASLFAAIPAAPGYAGTFDAGLVLGLKAVGVTGGTAVGFIVLARFVMFVPVTLAGLFVLVHYYGGFGMRRNAGSAVAGSHEEPQPHPLTAR